jgi:hypothetical protein
MSYNATSQLTIRLPAIRPSTHWQLVKRKVVSRHRGA